MTEITHVVVQLERQREATFHVFAEVGYPDVDDIVSAVEYGPVELDEVDVPALREDDLLAVLRELSAALKDDAGISITVEELRSRAVIDLPES